MKMVFYAATHTHTQTHTFTHTYIVSGSVTV